MDEPETLQEHLKRTRAPRNRIPGPLGSGVPEPLMQADAAARGAANMISFGLADKAEAGLEALLHRGLVNLPQSFATSAAQQDARTRYDTENRRNAQLAGQIGGAGLALAVEAPVTGMAAAARLPGVARLTGRETASMLGVGGVAGAGMQGVGDVIEGRPSSLGDYAGAALGGAAGVAATPLGAGRAAAIDGAVTSVAQDIFNGRPISPESAGRSATAARAFGGLADEAAMARAAALSRQAKGKLGEALGAARSVADWKPREAVEKKLENIKGSLKRWVPDGMHGDLKANFQLNHFLPRDIGMILSKPAASAGAQAAEQRRASPRQR